MRKYMFCYTMETIAESTEYKRYYILSILKFYRRLKQHINNESKRNETVQFSSFRFIFVICINQREKKHQCAFYWNKFNGEKKNVSVNTTCRNFRRSRNSSLYSHPTYTGNTRSNLRKTMYTKRHWYHENRKSINCEMNDSDGDGYQRRMIPAYKYLTKKLVNIGSISTLILGFCLQRERANVE